MKNLTDFLNNENNEIDEARMSWMNVHDAILNVLRKYDNKPGVPQDVKNYCTKVREALDKIK
jgi:hypothetical protein